MVIAHRPRGDELLKPGALVDLRARLRRMSPQHDLATVVACAFDHRTRMLPFIFADTRMAPAGVRAIGSALCDVGFPKTRIVLQQWNKRFLPSQMRLDGRVPDLFMVSSMGLHVDQALGLIRDAHRIPPAQRPLIIAGGPQAVYQPYAFFSADPANPAGADVVVTGEEFVLLSLLEVVLSIRGENEPMRNAFYRARARGLLDGVLGLVYPRGDHQGIPVELVDTGTQRLLGDLDELPSPVLGYRLLEPPGRRATLADRALPVERVRRYSPISSVVWTFGCKFACPYCPIPSYNQRRHRLKSGQRIAEELNQLNRVYGLRYFFGADDNFFNDHQRTLDIVQTLARAQFDGVTIRQRARWYTEVTVHDTLKMREHLPLIREAGCRALWLGVEDMTATLVKKGQDASKTTQAFGLLSDAGICPMPMMMHHDAQPLYTRGSNYGLINQVNQLRRAGAASLQVLMLVPSAGSALYDETYTSGQVFEQVTGRPVEPHMHDGNYVVASQSKRPWRKQVNLLLAYICFYNPLWLLVTLFRKSKLGMKPAGMQVIGMLGVTQNIRRTLGWAIRLAAGRIRRAQQPPRSLIPMSGIDARGPNRGDALKSIQNHVTTPTHRQAEVVVKPIPTTRS